MKKQNNKSQSEKPDPPGTPQHACGVDDAEPFPISPVSNPVPREDNFKRALLVNFCVAPGPFAHLLLTTGGPGSPPVQPIHANLSLLM